MSEFLSGADQAQQPAVEQQPTQQPQAQADQPFLVLGERVFKTQDEVTTKIESADMFIDQLKQENAELRGKLEGASKVDDVISALNQQEPQQVTQQVVQEVHTPSTDEPSVEEMVQKALAQTRATEQANANLADARKAFADKFGDKVGEAYTAKLEQLGMSDAVASNLAKTSPEAFKELFVGAQTGQTVSTSIASTSGVNTVALSQKPAEPVKVHQIKDKAARKLEISRRIEEAAEKYRNGTL